MDILKIWQKFEKLPLGQQLFSRFLGLKVPYTGSIKAVVQELRPGYCKVQMKDRHSLRNHFNSIHAVALLNLGEMTSGLAMNAAIPPTLRGIPTKLEIEYFKKSRGTLSCESTFDKSFSGQSEDVWVEAKIFNQAAEETARIRALWKVSPVK